MKVFLFFSSSGVGSDAVAVEKEVAKGGEVCGRRRFDSGDVKFLH